jgi:hypothetical protein
MLAGRHGSPAFVNVLVQFIPEAAGLLGSNSIRKCASTGDWSRERAAHEKDCGAAHAMKNLLLEEKQHKLFTIHNQSSLTSKALLLVFHIKNGLIFTSLLW